MTTYGTGNPLGSTAPKDLYDNAQNIDDFANGQSLAYPDRFGVARLSLAGLRNEVDQALINMGYESTHLTYVDGTPLVVQRPTQLIDRGGSVFRVKLPQTFPLTLTGTFATDAPKLLDVGDAALRGALAAPTGAAMVGTRTGTVEQRFASGPDTFFGYASLQAALNAQTPGGTLYIPPGAYTITAQLTMSIPGVTLWLDDAATINYNIPTTFTALLITGAGCTVRGGKNGGWVGPAVWDGLNVSPSYAVIRIEADRCRIETRLVNVQKVGIWFKDCSYGIAWGCDVQGNYPVGQWTGIETVHYGILLDPGTGAFGGSFKVQSCTIASCVQGILAGNYGVGGIARGINITGNEFEGMWNHAIYSNYTDGAVIVGNNFNRCQLPVVASGRYNVIEANSLHTAIGTVGDERDVVGISLRDCSMSVVSGNSIKGVVTGAANVVINLQYFAGIVDSMNGNIINGNTIDITGGLANPIRIEGTSTLGATNCSNNIISNNVIRAPLNSDGAILLDGIATGANHGNQINDNNITILAGNDGIRANNQLMAAIHGNTIDWEYDAGSAQTCVGVRLFGTSQFCSVVNNSYVVDFQFGANLNITGLAETAPASSNICHNNHDKTSTAKALTFFKVSPAPNSLMDIQETGPGAPTMSARSGSTWRRYPFGSTGSSLYVKESSNAGSDWTPK